MKVTACAACSGIGGDETHDGEWKLCGTCDGCGFLVDGRLATLAEYLRITGGRVKTPR